jgi:hypothetical protein
MVNKREFSLLLFFPFKFHHVLTEGIYTDGMVVVL